MNCSNIETCTAGSRQLDCADFHLDRPLEILICLRTILPDDKSEAVTTALCPNKLPLHLMSQNQVK